MNSVIDNQIQYETLPHLSPNGTVTCIYEFLEDPVTGDDFFTGMTRYEFKVSKEQFDKIRGGAKFTVENFFGGRILKMVDFHSIYVDGSVEVICVKA